MVKDRFGKSALMYEGSVKRIYSSSVSPESLVFEFTDDYSVFDWGKMPDTIPLKGEVLAKLASIFFLKLQDASKWKEFFASNEGRAWKTAVRSKLAFATRSDSREAGTNGLGALEKLEQSLLNSGLKTHYQGFEGGRELFVQKIHVHRPTRHSVFGMQYYSYPPGKTAPFLIPLEVVFRFEVAAGSSFIKRNYDRAFKVGDTFNPPFVETFTKLEPQDRALSTSEAAAMSGLSPAQFEELFLKTTLVASILKTWFAKAGIRLVDGKLEWGLDASGEVVLVDAIGPDEMRLEKDGLKLSKELLRDFYRQTDWYTELEKAKQNAEATGSADWKSSVKAPPALPAELKILTSEMYQSLVNEVTGTREFACRSLAEITQGLKNFLKTGAV